MVEHNNDSGNVKISDEAIATIASIAAKEVDGVFCLDSGTVGGLAEAFGVKDLSKGVRVEFSGENVSVNINLMVCFGRDIADVASEVQDKVRESIESMTGLLVDKVHVNINGVRKPEKPSGDAGYDI
ncbi:MAG: Asp23/Gls24 family envelope stress response protein [Spirochaetia bacterium]|nr:Asp23/Gls24 family envelope stress response protein [Spirochaetia bacterium]